MFIFRSELNVPFSTTALECFFASSSKYLDKTVILLLQTLQMQAHELRHLSVIYPSFIRHLSVIYPLISAVVYLP